MSKPGFLSGLIKRAESSLPVHVWIGVFVAGICLALVGLDGWWMWSARAVRLDAARGEAMTYVERVAQHAEAAFDVADDMLLGMAERMETDGDGPAAMTRMHKLLAGRVAAFPRLYEAAVIGADGKRLASSMAPGAVLDDPHLTAVAEYHRTHPDSGAYVDAVLQSQRNGQLLVSVSRGFKLPDGRFGGAVQAVIDLSYFNTFYRRLNLSAHGTVSLWREDGTLLVREPPVADALGEGLRVRDAARMAPFHQQSGVLEVRAKVDRERRIYAFQHLGRLPLVAFYGVSKRDALLPWWDRILTQGGILAVFLAGVALAGWRLARQSRRTRSAEDAYRLLAENCTDVVFKLDLQLRIEFITPSVLERAGLQSEQFIGHSLLQYLHPEDRSYAAAVYHAVAAGQDRAVVEYRLMHVAGNWRWVEVELTLLRSKVTGAPMTIIGASRDVTARRAAEDALKAEQAFFQAVFEYTTESLFVQNVLLDGSFPAERINAAAAQSIGLDAAAAAIGKTPRALFGDAHGAVVEARLREVLDAERPLSVADRVAHGQTWEMIAVAIPAAEGRIERILLSARDVTDQRRMQQAETLLRAGEEQRRLAAEAASERLDRLARHLARARDQAELANQAKTRFLTNMSHELRTPLNGILGYAKLLQMDGGLSPGQASHVEAVRVAGRHLLEMIAGILDVAQIDADQVTLQNIDVNLAEVVLASLSLVRPAADSKGLKLIFEVGADEPVRLLVDPVRLRQVLLNLVGNAVKFTPSGTVEVRLLWNAGHTTMRVEILDTGPGIPLAQRARLFEAFERLDETNQSLTDGTGVGLMLAARLVGAMGGRIGCETGVGGVGSVFWFELPALLMEAEPAPVPADNGVSTPWRLLVVDDIANNRDIAAAFLRSAHHRVTTAASGAAAVRAAAAKLYDAILMDVRMPGMDGLEATRQIRALPGPNGQVPIVAVTAQAFPDQIAACHAAGMDHHLSKPFEVEELLMAVAVAVAREPRQPVQALPIAPVACDLPVLDRATFDATAAYLPAPELSVHLHALVGRAQGLLAAMQGTVPAGEKASQAHAIAGAAGTFGFMQIADIGRRYEYAVETNAPDSAALAAALIDTTIATIAALKDVAGAPLATA